jgi:hypothetical protein
MPYFFNYLLVKFSSKAIDRVMELKLIMQGHIRELPEKPAPLPRSFTPSNHAPVFYLRERNFNMLKKDLILRNPLRLLAHQNEDILNKGEFGAVIARAGVGKTALLVQLALNSQLRSKNVLHVSLDDPVSKVTLWYEEVFRNITQYYQIKRDDQLWEAILPYRFIMTFKTEGFSVPKLEERIDDLTEQNIFLPQFLIVDGLSFEDTDLKVLSDLKALANQFGLRVWFTVKSHRHALDTADSIPAPLAQFQDLFEVVVVLLPQANKIQVHALKGVTDTPEAPQLYLDPATMLIKDK